MISNETAVEIVERLRAAKPHCNHHANAGLCHEAAAFIEQALVEASELRGERDALLQKPVDLAKMDSIDDEDGTPDKMIAYYWHRQAQDALGEASALREALFEPLESDASFNLQGVLDDLRGQANPNDGGVCARTVERVIEQLEKARAALATTKGGES